MTKPFIKWAGGKYRLADKLVPFISKDFNPSKNRYFEPMVGSGGFFFRYAPKNAYLSDVNPKLIDTYKTVKDHRMFEDLLGLLRAFERTPHTKDSFLRIREEFNKEGLHELETASYFIYLNKMCFNGLYRENSKGHFNVPMGDKREFVVDESNLRNVNNMLQNVDIRCHGFEDCIEHISAGDFVYLDPPYIPKDPLSFTKYSKNDFGKKQHEELSIFCDKVHSKGAFFMLSNSDTDLTNDLYMKEGRFKNKFLVSRTIASKAKNRTKAKEVIITNYKGS